MFVGNDLSTTRPNGVGWFQQSDGAWDSDSRLLGIGDLWRTPRLVVGWGRGCWSWVIGHPLAGAVEVVLFWGTPTSFRSLGDTKPKVKVVVSCFDLYLPGY